MKGITSITVTQFLLAFLLVLSLFGVSLVFSDDVQRAVLSGIESVGIKGAVAANAGRSTLDTQL